MLPFRVMPKAVLLSGITILDVCRRASTLRGPPAGLLGRGRDTPAGEEIERNKGGPVRLRNLAAVQHRCIHLLLSNQCANSKKLIAARSKLFWIGAPVGFISLFFIAFMTPISFSLVPFSRIFQGAMEN